MSKKDNDMIKMLGRTLAMPCLLILTLIALNFYDKASNLFLSSSLAMTLFFIFYLFINILPVKITDNKQDNIL